MTDRRPRRQPRLTEAQRQARVVAIRKDERIMDEIREFEAESEQRRPKQG